MRSNANDHIFQAIAWHAEDVPVDSETADGKEEMRYMIKCFGRKQDGRTISASISDFAPYFYIKVYDSWNARHIKALHEAIVSHLPSDMVNCVLSIRLTEKKDFWGFSNFRLFKFARLRFQNLKTMKWVQKMLSSPFQIRMLSNVFTFPLYESNIDPFIRFMHHQNIEPTGWIRLPAGKYRAYTEIMPTICDEDVEIKWKDVEKAPPQTSSAPFLVASFDIECVNNFGEFPVPRKDFRKMASQLYEVFQKMPASFSLYDKVKRLGQCIYYALDIPVSSAGTDIEKSDNFDVASHMTKIEFKRPIKKEKVRQYFEKYLDNLIMDTLMGVKNKKLVGLKNRDYKTYEKTKDGVIVNDMTNLLNSARIGEIKGDEIIQIGTTFHKYGERGCCKKVIICLRETNSVDDAEVIVCNTEEDVLISWRDLMMRENPDIMTGYNIFGFDFVYLHQRAQDLGIASMFMQLSRFKDVTCSFCEKQLSSSALGDNILRYIDMHGRVLIDLMKVVQRDHKLDEYKLDTVAKHFLGMQKDDVSPQDIVRFYHGNADDRSVIAKYCIKDCELCNQLMIKLEIVTNNMGMSNVCLVPLSYIFMRGQGIKIFSLVMKQCSDDNYCIPVVKKGMDQGPNAREGDDVLANVEDQESYEGAIVLDPKEGIYIDDPVSVMDYSSLYPSSMISENLSHDCMVIDRQYDNLPGVEYLDIEYDVYAGKGDKKVKAGITSSRFVQLPNGEKGIVPRILVKLLDARKSTRKMIEFQTVTLKNGLQYTGLYDDSTRSMKMQDKSTVQIDAQNIEKIENTYNDFQKAVLDGLQLAYKVTANSLYGQMGAKTSPLYLKDIAACTTATGRNMILKAKAFLEENFGANIIYGDSVTSYTPVYVKDQEGVITLCTIDSIADRYGHSKWIPCTEEGRQTKEACELHDVETWTENGWTPLKRVIRHALAPHKKIVRVLTHTGLVDVTDDHSLLNARGDAIKPKEASLGTELLHHDIPLEVIHCPDAPCYMLSFAHRFSSAVHCGYDPTIQVGSDGKPILVIDSNTKDNRDTRIQKMFEIPYEGYVYDLTTENHHFAAGVGTLILHNTDSVFATFPNKDEHGNKLTGHAAIQTSISTAIEASKQFRPLIKRPHDLEYEKSFWPFILLSKKRYVGNLYEMDDQKFKQKSMGIVLKRRDNAHIVKTVYGGIIDIILNKQDIPGSVRFLNENLQKLIQGNYPVEELVITKSLRANYKNPDSIAHKVLAERIGERDPGNKPQVNDRIPFVYIDMTHASNGNGKGKSAKKVLQGERIEHPDYIRKKKLVPDYGFYITNQIMNPVTQVYGIVPHQIPHNTKSKNYYEMLYAKIRAEETAKANANNTHLDERKVKEKYAAECEKDVQKLLFDPYLEKIVHQRIHKSNHTILEYFKPKK